MRALRLLAHGAMVAFLTALSQLGGLAWLGALLLARGRGRLAFLGAFLALHAGASLAARALAPMAGRVALPCFEGAEAPLASASPLYCVLNRNYVVPELAALAHDLARAMERAHPGTLVLTLDGNFPFGDGFPLLPHLSHDDGRKLDLAFLYRDAEGYRRGRVASPLGYWGFEAPPPGARDGATGGGGACPARWPTLRWDMDWFQPLVDRELRADDARMRSLLGWLTREGARRGIGRILLEPHLKARWAPGAAIVRFQGCAAARHDDHIHIQLR